ncbi:PREDICTED: uncharacterized protein LOC104586856 [Nelumbo nucifera]|uniref:Uncharacterized protein LOC104586856 n=1 Tax=Nelumbo nucifera TaxID=4432 RepID=A0A1U7YTQ9_NELNU|nr:PREDICTED: uncharacterized protein LOC104586856 [Nelumbo nucifera]
MVVDFYKSLFTERGWRWVALGGLEPRKLSDNSARWLEREVEVEEIRDALKIEGDKTPRLDGFNFSFIKACWGFMEEDFVQMIKEFSDSRELLKRLNATFVALIQKKDGAVNIKDFRLISLISNPYKFLAKILSWRLKAVWHEVVGDTQVAFVEGRQILDKVLVANECIGSRLRSGRLGLVCKIDIEKAYNHVEWGFLEEMQRLTGFGEKWRGWMYACVSSVAFSLLLNGVSLEFFQASRGLWQGDSITFY